jgi:hypothetical protein
MRISILFFAVLAVIWPQAAHAYFDPGTGSMIIQGLIAGLAGGWFLFRTQWDRLKNFFAKDKVREASED